MTSESDERLDPRQVRTRARVLAAARTVLRRDGLGGATIDAIATEAGVARSTVYRNWTTRDDVLAAVRHLGADARPPTARARPRPRSAAARLAGLAVGAVPPARGGWADAALTRPQYSDALARWSAMSAVPCCAALVLLVSSGCVEPPPAETATNLAPDPLPQAVYLIGEDDTLAAIAHRFAVPGGWRALAAANHLLDPDHIEAGAGLVIPTAGLEAFGRDPFSLYDEYELVPRRPPIELPPEPTSSDDVDWLPDSDTADACGGRHHHLPLSPEALSFEDTPRCAWLADATVCIEDDGGDTDDGVAVTVDDQAWLRLPWSFIEPLEIVEVDLDGDGAEEVVLADLEVVSNGASIRSYAMVVADRAGGPAHRYTSNGWRLDRRADGGCALLHQTFEGIDDPLAGDGNYDVVRELVWEDGALATRGAGIRADRWSHQPQQLRAEPRLEPQVLSRRVGTVVDFDGRPAQRQALTLAIGAERVTLRAPSDGWSDDAADDPADTYVGLGWAGAEVLLPADYRPPAATLIGRTATVETRLTLPDGTLSQIVWLDRDQR